MPANLFMRIQKRVDDSLDYLGEFYFSTMLILHIAYVLAFIGLVSLNHTYLFGLNVCVQLIICSALMFRFHPFRKHELRKYDPKIIFGSACFLLFNLLLTWVVGVFLKNNKELKTVENEFKRFTPNKATNTTTETGTSIALA